MIPSRALTERIQDLIRNDADNFRDPATPLLSVWPISGDFVYTPTLTLADLVFDTTLIDSSRTEMGAVDKNFLTFQPGTNLTQIDIQRDSGSLTVGSFGQAYPINVYGLAMVAKGGTKLLAVERFDQPLLFTADSQVFFIKPPQFTFPLEMWN